MRAGWNASSPHLRRRAEKDFRDEKWTGAIKHQRSVDVRYQGQGYELNVPYTRNLIRDFRSEHQRRYGYSYPARDSRTGDAALAGHNQIPISTPEPT